MEQQIEILMEKKLNAQTPPTGSPAADSPAASSPAKELADGVTAEAKDKASELATTAAKMTAEETIDAEAAGRTGAISVDNGARPAARMPNTEESAAAKPVAGGNQFENPAD